MFRTACLVLLLLVVSSVRPSWGREIGPDVDWCTIARSLEPGEELVLSPGDHRGGCTIWQGGRDGAPIVIRGSDPGDPPRLVYLGSATNVVNVRASHVTLRNLAFGPSLPAVDGVRVYEARDVAIEDCVFTDLGGIAIVANHSVRGLRARRNRILRSRSTAVYLGCHDGAGCEVTGALLEQNLIHGVQAGPREVGYGIQVKLNSEAAIRDNVIVDTKGPGIMVYGSADPLRVSVVERNFVAGSRTSSAIVIGGGPATVRNNILVRSAQAGVGVEDYGRRSLLRGIAIVHNTIWGNRDGGITVPDGSRLEVRIFGNAVHAPAPRAALPRPRPGLASAGNTDCSQVACFQNPWADDFSPLALGLVNPDWSRELGPDDYFARPRPAAVTVGAIEPPGGPVRMDIKTLDR